MVNHRQIGVGFFGLGSRRAYYAKPLTERIRSIRQKINGTFPLDNVLINDAQKPRKITLHHKALTPYHELLISKTIGGHSVTLQLIQVEHSRGKDVITFNKEVMAKQ